MTTSITISPNYLLIGLLRCMLSSLISHSLNSGVLILGLVLLIVGVILGIYFFRKRRLGDGISGQAGYRKLGYDYTSHIVSLSVWPSS